MTKQDVSQQRFVCLEVKGLKSPTLIILQIDCFRAWFLDSAEIKKKMSEG